MRTLVKLILACLLPIVLVALFFIVANLVHEPPIYKKHIVFKDNAKAVQDSMIALRKICESVNSQGFMNCFVSPFDSTLTFNQESLGKFRDVKPSNKAFEPLKKEDAVRVLSILNFLNKNLISGVFHDTSIGGLWLYNYGDRIEYYNIKYIRHLYIVENPSDTLKPIFKYYNSIIDRKGKFLLLAYKNLG